MKKSQKFYPYIFLTIFACLLIFIIWPNNTSFGSMIDWSQQHIKIAEYFRTLFLKNGELFPDYATHLGGGINIYALSYYGLFRLDVLISYVFPFIDMEYIVVTYIILEYIASVNLCFAWLKKHNIQKEICFLSAILLATSSLLFQSHRQIMFINYMPYLFCTLLAIDNFLETKKIRWIPLSVALIILHSYFFSVTAIILCTGYFFFELTNKTEKKSLITKYIGAISIGIGMCAVLLFPTAYYMLHIKKDKWNPLSLIEIWGITPSLRGLLYYSYGAGLTIIVLFVLILSLQYKRTRKMGAVLLFCLCSNLVAYLLNGTLYVRYKIYLVFLPFILYVFAKTLQEIYYSEKKLHLFPLFFAGIPVLTIYLFDHRKTELPILLDVIVSFVLLILFCQKKNTVYLFLSCILPFVICIQLNGTEIYPTKEKSVFSDAELTTLCSTYRGRFLDTTTGLLNVNDVFSADTYKTTMYSSLSNGEYNTFYYDYMKNPISIRNRVVLSSNPNILFQHLMHVTTMETKQKTLPIGYEIMKKKNGIVLAKTEDSMPFAYATNTLYSQKEFKKLSYPKTIDVLTQSAVVDTNKMDFKKRIQKEKFSFTIKNKGKENQTVSLPKEYNSQVLLLSFDIDRKDGKEVIIDINGIRNKLSSKDANYPNNNTTFTYVLSSNNPMKELHINASKGNYRIKNVQLYSLPYTYIQRRNQTVDTVKLRKTTKKEVLKGNVNVSNNGYLITSIPYEKGFTAYIDGKKVPVEQVNTCFVGFPIDKGIHNISIVFHAPAKQFGLIISGLSFILFIIFFNYKRRFLWKRKH
ncbi:YfhO family protein [Faecalimonas sp.]